jgi:hypothetical protein
MIAFVAPAAVLTATMYFSVRGLLRGWRARRILARLGPASSAIEERGESPVMLRGVLGGGELATGFGGSVRTIEDAHMRASSITRPEHVWIRVGQRDIALAGPLQVVLGSHEALRSSGGDRVSVRRVRSGDVVIAEGVIKTVSAGEGEAGYRDRAIAYELVPVTDTAWPGRPITVYSARGRAAGAYWVLGLLSLVAVAGLGYGVARARQEREMSSSSVAARPACAASIGALLDRGDPFAANALVPSCDEALSRASPIRRPPRPS